MNPAQTPIDIDLLICPEWVIPIEPAGAVLNGHALAVDNGRIVELLPRAAAEIRYRARERAELPGQVVLPGLVNLHAHAAMNLMRGYADDLPLMRWLQERIWPAEARHVSADFVRAGTLLAAAEMLRGGVTCCNDMYFFPQAAAEAYQRLGMRATLGMVVIEFPSTYAADADDYLAKGLACRDAWSGHELIRFALAPHAPYTVSDRSFERIATLAAQLDLPVHMHVHETRQEIDESLQRHGMRPLQRLQALGLLTPHLIAVHAVHLTGSEIELLAREGSHLALCPSSNLKLASGIAPLAEIERAGINFGLGTDGAASNNRLDVLQEIRLAALLAKGASGDAQALGAHAALHAATLGGARALGLDDCIGSLLPGKAADLFAIRLDDWIAQPAYDAASHIIYVAGREQVSTVWVNGRTVVQDGIPCAIPESELLAISSLWHTSLTK